jgi:hypothetical protein
MVDCVEKPSPTSRPVFLRAADASNAVRHGGPHQVEQSLSTSFHFALGMHPPNKSTADKLFREFFLGSTFDFFDRIGPLLTCMTNAEMPVRGGRAD